MLPLEDFLHFLEAAPTSWHCVEEVSKRLTQAGFVSLEENRPFSLERGNKYFVTRGGSLCAFCLPKQDPAKTVILGAHTDSPALKIKPNPTISQGGMQLLEVDTYGSPILHSWLNRDLVIAGRYFVQEPGGQITQKLLTLADSPFLIPELAIHLDRDVNQKGPQLNKQEHLMPLFSGNEAQSFSSFLEKQCPGEKILSFDFMLVPAEKPKLLGTSKEWIASYRLDNLTSVHAALCALLTYQESSILPLAIFWDHEEIGSTTWEGAASSFFPDLLTRLKSFYQLSEEDFCIFKRNSFCFSLDMAHALNPMHPQKYDPNHKPLLGKGIALKEQAGQKYASSGATLAQTTQYAKQASISLQHFVPRSDVGCGSTIGPIVSSQLGIPTVDLGCPQLSMHSAREMIAVQDYKDVILLLQTALQGSSS